MTKTHDVSKLPVWAQDKLKNAQYDIDRLERQLALAQNGGAGGETNVYIFDGLSDKTYLPNDTHVDFQLADGYHNAISVGLTTDAAGRRSLRVNGNSAIAILPRATNLIEIEIKE